MPDPYGRYRDPATDMRGVRAFVASPLHSTFRAWFDKFLPLPKTAAWAWIPEPLMAAAWAASATWGEFYREVNARCGCGVFSVFAKDVLQAPPPYGPGLGKVDRGEWEIARPRATTGGGSPPVSKKRTGWSKAMVATFFAATDDMRAWEQEQAPRQRWSGGGVPKPKAR